MFLDNDQLLQAETADRQDESPAYGELFDQRCGHMVRRGCGDDQIEWGLFRPAFVRVAVAHFDVVVAQLAQPPGSRIVWPNSSRAMAST